MMTTNNYVLVHHGIKGQKWGVRRYQNADGSRTSAGLAHDRQLYAEANGKLSSGSTGSLTTTSTERKGLTDSQKQALKTAGKIALAAAAVGATAYLYSQNKEAIDSTIHQMGAQLTNKLPTQTAKSGRSFVSGVFEDTQSNIYLKANQRQHREDAVNAVKDKVTTAVATVSETGDKVTGAAKNAVNNVGDSAKNAAGKVKESAKTSVSNVKKSASDGLSKAAKSAEDKATAYLVTRTMEKASEQRLKNKQEKNRHKEEMARIRRGN